MHFNSGFFFHKENFQTPKNELVEQKSFEIPVIESIRNLSIKKSTYISQIESNF